MARAFKEYREAVKAKRENEREQERQRQAEEQARQAYIDGLKIGAKVKYSEFENSRTGQPVAEIGYFVSDTGSGFIWIARTKADALSGYGATILKTSIIF